MSNLLIQGNLTQLLTRLRADLIDTGDEHLPDGNELLEETIASGIRDIGRHIPQQLIYECNVEDETISSERLGYSRPYGGYIVEEIPMRRFSEHLWTADADGSNPTSYYTRGTDYVLNYATGEIYTVDGGGVEDDGLENDRWLFISYEKATYAINLRKLWSFPVTGDRLNPIRITNVEYPVGATPQNFISFDIWGDLLFPHWPVARGSSVFRRHIAIHYETDQSIQRTIGGEDVQWPYSDGGQTLADEHLDISLWEDIGDINYFDDELLKAVIAAAHDMFRHIPLQLIRDYEFISQVTDEEFSLGSEDLLYDNTAGLHQLNWPVEPFSEEVYSGAGKTGTKYTRGIDYEMDYLNGRIGFWYQNPVWRNTSLEEDVTYYISYMKNPRVLCIAPLNLVASNHTDELEVIPPIVNTQNYTANNQANPIRITAVEYPVDQIPRRFIPFSDWGDRLLLGERLTSGRLVRVYWEGEFVPIE